MLKKPSVHSVGVDGYAVFESKWPGIQDGAEILTTPLTCTATNFPILANHFKIKWVDIDPETLNMDLDDLARKITPKTKAIFIVHWGGYPINLDRLAEIQNQASRLYGFKPAIIEDCAHAMGSKYKGILIGTHGNICTFSLQAIKHITSGDGGLLFVPHDDLYKRGKLLRWYGIDRDGNRKDFRCEADIPEWGFKFHMNDVNATVGMCNFAHRDEIIKKHQENAAYYDQALKQLKACDNVQLFLGESLQSVEYSHGQEIIREGEEGDRFYIVEKVSQLSLRCAALRCTARTALRHT
jgi:dTDP-4-amino-4,6-dideoxygalactose transaminase